MDYAAPRGRKIGAFDSWRWPVVIVLHVLVKMKCCGIGSGEADDGMHSWFVRCAKIALNFIPFLIPTQIHRIHLSQHSVPYH